MIMEILMTMVMEIIIVLGAVEVKIKYIGVMMLRNIIRKVVSSKGKV